MEKCFDSIPQADQKLILIPLPAFSLRKTSNSASTPRGQRSEASRRGFTKHRYCPFCNCNRGSIIPINRWMLTCWDKGRTESGAAFCGMRAARMESPDGERLSAERRRTFEARNGGWPHAAPNGGRATQRARPHAGCHDRAAERRTPPDARNPEAAPCCASERMWLAWCPCSSSERLLDCFWKGVPVRKGSGAGWR